MPKTKRGIYHNLKESQYTISNDEVVFFFSSVVYLNKFLEGYKDNRKNVEHALSKVLDGVPANSSFFADVRLYQAIEKRGFHVTIKGVAVQWQELYQYALQRMTRPNITDWSRTPRPK